MALVVFSLVMGSLAGIFISSSVHLAALRDRQQAAALATRVLEVARSVAAVPDAVGCVPLLVGRSAAAVTAQWAAAPREVDLSTSDLVSAPAGCTGVVGLPLQGLPTSAGAVQDPVLTGGQRFTVRTYVGICRSARPGGTCARAAASPSGALMYRLIAAVSWPDATCDGTCTFALPTLVSPATDPMFYADSLALYPPTLETAGPGDGRATATWSPPVASSATVFSYTATATRVGGTGTGTCRVDAPALTCAITGLTNGALYNVSVVANTSSGDGPASNVLQVRPYPTSVMSAAGIELWLDAADTATLLASSSCTGAPASTAVGCWKDKSPSLNDAVQTDGTRQGRTSTLAGLPAVAFDGTSTWYWLDAKRLPLGTQPMTIYAVAVQEDATPAASCFRHLIAWGGGGVNGRARMLHKGCWNSAVYLDTYDTWQSMAPTKSWPTGTVAVAKATTTSGAVTVGVNGADSYTWYGRSDTGSWSGAQLGNAPWWASAAWKGRIAEVVIVNSVVSQAQDAAMLDYLATKWNVPVVAGAPTAVGVTRSTDGTTATVTWTEPAFTGSDPVTTYSVTGRPVGSSGPTVMVACEASPCTAGPVTPGTSYTWTVLANSVAGAGNPSAAVTR